MSVLDKLLKRDGRFFAVDQLTALLELFVEYSGISRPMVCMRILRGVLRKTVQFGDVTTYDIRSELKAGNPSLGLNPINVRDNHFYACWAALVRSGWLIHTEKTVYLNLPRMIKLMKRISDDRLDTDTARKFKDIIIKVETYWTENDLQTLAIQGEKEFMQRYETDHPSGVKAAERSQKAKVKLEVQRKFKPAQKLTPDDVRKELTNRLSEHDLELGPWNGRTTGSARVFIKECLGMGLDPRKVILAIAEKWSSMKVCFFNDAGAVIKAPDIVISFDFLFTHRRRILDYLRSHENIKCNVVEFKPRDQQTPEQQQACEIIC